MIFRPWSTACWPARWRSRRTGATPPARSSPPTWAGRWGWFPVRLSRPACRDAAPGAGGQAWPAGLAGLAGGIPGPEPGLLSTSAPGGPPNVRSPQDRPGAPPPAGYEPGSLPDPGPAPDRDIRRAAGRCWRCLAARARRAGMGTAAARAAIPRQDRGRGYRRGSHRGGGRGHGFSSASAARRPYTGSPRLVLSSRRHHPSSSPSRRSPSRHRLAVSLTGTVIAAGPGPTRQSAEPLRAVSKCADFASCVYNSDDLP